MTLGVTISAITVQANGVTTAFAYPFNMADAADAVITYTDPAGAQTVLSAGQYHITGIGAPTGGTVTYPLSGPPVAFGSLLTIQRIVPLVQTTSVVSQGPTFGAIEDELDYEMMVDQQLQFQLDRTLQLNRADINPMPELPPAVVRANQFLFFDATGDPTVASVTSGGVVVSIPWQVVISNATTQGGLALINYLAPLAGSVIRNLVSKLSDFVNVRDFGAHGDSVTNDAAAFTAALAVSDEVHVTQSTGSYVIGTNVTVPNGKRLVIHSGASLSLSGGVTFTVHGLLDAPRDEYIFPGAGSAIGMRTVYPEWWGAQVGNAAFDSQPAMVLAHTAVQGSLTSDGGRPTIILGAGTYYVGNTWTIAPTANIQLAVIGEGSIFGGTRIQTLAGFPASPVVYVTGNTDATQMISDWAVSGFAIENGGGVPSVGLQVGTSADATHNLIGLLQSVIEDVLVDDNGATRGFPIGIQFCHVRLVNVRRTSVWSRVGATGSAADARQAIKIIQTGGFTGDLTFDNVQYVGSINAAMAGLEISCTSGPAVAADHSIAGLRFNGLIGYNCGRYVNISAQAGSFIHDIWFNPGCQFDGGSISGIFVQSDGAGTLIQDIHLQGCFIDGATADQVNIVTSATGQIQDMWVTDNWSSQTFARFVVAGSASGMISGLHVCDNEINNNSTAGASITITGNATYFRVNGNIATRQAAVTMNWLVQIGLGCSEFIVTENIAHGIAATATISDLSGAVSKVVGNNL